MPRIRGAGWLCWWRPAWQSHVIPELPALQLEIDEHHRHKDVYEHSLTVLEQAIERETRLDGGGPDLVTRLAALLHDIGKPATRRFEPGGGVSFHHHEMEGAKLARRRLTALRFPKQVVDDVSDLVRLHLRFHGYATGEWTDSAVRRYVTDAGPLLSRLHILTRADSTTRNRRRAEALQRQYDHLEERIARLAEREALDAIRPDLDGNEIMTILGLSPGPLVGKAYGTCSTSGSTRARSRATRPSPSSVAGGRRSRPRNDHVQQAFRRSRGAARGSGRATTRLSPAPLGLKPCRCGESPA